MQAKPASAQDPSAAHATTAAVDGSKATHKIENWPTTLSTDAPTSST